MLRIVEIVAATCMFSKKGFHLKIVMHLGSVHKQVEDFINSDKTIALLES